MQLTETQMDFLTRFLGVGPPEVQPNLGQKQPPGGVSAMKLGMARLDWIGVRETALRDVSKLQGNIREAFAAQPEASKAVEAGITRLGMTIHRISEDLNDELDDVLNQSDPAKRANLARDAAATARGFLKLVDNDPVISAIDGTVYMPDISVVKPMKKSLNAILGALGQATAAE